MIVEWLIEIGFGVVVTFLGWFPEIGLNDYLLAVGAFTDLAVGAGSLGVWVDWGFIGVASAFVLGLFALFTIVKAVLRFVGHIPGFGGNW